MARVFLDAGLSEKTSQNAPFWNRSGESVGFCRLFALSCVENR